MIPSSVRAAPRARAGESAIGASWLDDLEMADVIFDLADRLTDASGS